MVSRSMPVDTGRQAPPLFGPDHPSLHQILDMSADRCGGRVGKRRVEALHVRADRRDRGVCGLDAGEDRGFSPRGGALSCGKAKA